jgi:ribosomal protein S18 acetylase RimI-like enzyme
MLEGLEISTDPARVDVALVHEFLRTTYWAEGRPREVVERSIANSLCFGGYLPGGQIAFGRVITDRALFGYLSDIFVLPAYRGRGVGTALVRAMMEHPDVAPLKVVLLRTRDAHGLYRQFGFRELPAPDEMMITCR